MTDPVAVGDVVADKYLILGVLGRGGIGVVYAAEHVTLRRRVALKFLRAELVDSPDVVRRFLREGRASAQLQSEHVARVMDADTTAQGAPYLVMELLEGRDLNAVLKEEGALPVETAVDYVLQACEAVAEAHALGILHRDLKSDNLFVTRSPLGQPLVKVLDFGLSKIETLEPDAGLTSDNHVMGSPHFMSPEQMRSSRDVDARSDLWALGVVLYTLLAGRVPFGGTYLTEVCTAVLSGDVAPLASFRADVPAGLEGVIARCLRLEREERFPTAFELAAALAPFAGAGGAARVARIARLVAERRGVDSSAPARSTDATHAGAAVPAAVVGSAASPPSPLGPSSSPVTVTARSRPRGTLALVLASGLLAAGLFAFLHRSSSAPPSVVAVDAPFAGLAVSAAGPVAARLPQVASDGGPSSPPASGSSATAAPMRATSAGSTGARASGTAPSAFPRLRVHSHRTPSDEDVILKLPH